MTASHTDDITNWTTGASTARRTKYARARVLAGLKYRDLQDMGFGRGTVQRADRGQLPKHQSTRDAYLKAIHLTEDDA